MDSQYWRDVIGPGDRASALAKEISFASHKNNHAVIVAPHQAKNFRGPVGFTWSRDALRGMASYRVGLDGYMGLERSITQEMESDGIGGKPQFFTLVGTPDVFRNLGWEIIAMNADDFARSGRFPAIMSNELDIKQITDENFHLFQALMEGYGDALKKAHLVNITGETAIMKHSITAFCDINSKEQLVLTWGASCVGLAAEKLMIDTSKIEPGMPIIGFSDPGYRCNGGTFLIDLILKKWGPDPRDILQNSEAIEFTKALTIPSQSYARTITRLVGWSPNGSIGVPNARIYGIAHITGGGVWSKFKEILPEGIGAYLSDMPDPADVLLQAQELSRDTNHSLTDWQAYSTFHGGCGMLLVVDKDDEAEIISQAEKDGIKAQFVGETIQSSTNEIIINSKFSGCEQLSSKKPN